MEVKGEGWGVGGVGGWRDRASAAVLALPGTWMMVKWYSARRSIHWACRWEREDWVVMALTAELSQWMTKGWWWR